MTVRLPHSLSSRMRPQSGLDFLDAEILAEKAAALGRTGEAVDVALRTLADHPQKDEARAALVAAAADAVLHFFVQREMSGFLTHDDAIRDYKIPNEVLARVGAR